jgi:membrane protein involved in colicin uptake
MSRRATRRAGSSRLERWLKFFTEGEGLDADALPEWMQTEEMQQAMNTLKGFSEKEREYHAYQARQNYLRQQSSIQRRLEELEAAAIRAQAMTEQARAAEEQARAGEEQARAAEEQARAAEEQARAAAEQARASEDRERTEKMQARAAEEQARAGEEQARARETAALQREAAAQAEVERLRRPLKGAPGADDGG